MIDPIGFKPSAVSERRPGTTDKIDVAAAVPKPARDQAGPALETAARGLARSAAASAPVDHERVQQIKRAIQDGRFPIVPAEIADRLIAAQLDWVSADESR